MTSLDPPTNPIPVQRPRGGAAWVVALFAAAVLLGVLALWAGTEAADRAAEADGLNRAADRANAQAKQAGAVDPGNEALADPERTREVIQFLNTAVAEILSYDYRDLTKTDRAVGKYLTGEARCVYDGLFGDVKRRASEQKIVLTTSVHELALVRLDADRAEALVFIDQESTRADTNQTTGGGAQFAFKAQRVGGHWKISDLDLFDQPTTGGEPAPNC